MMTMMMNVAERGMTQSGGRRRRHGVDEMSRDGDVSSRVSHSGMWQTAGIYGVNG